MATTTCPACNAPIDPARAPVARVRGGRVVTFCSQACADAPEGRTEGRTDVRGGAAPGARPGARPGAKIDAGRVAGSEAFGPGEAAASDARYDVAGRRPRGSGRRRVILLSAAILLGGMVITIVNAVSPSTPVDVRAHEHAELATRATGNTTATTTAPAGAPGAVPAAPVAPAAPGSMSASPEDEAPAAPAAADPYLAAQSTLRGLMKSPSARVQRIAAMALARLGAAEAAEAVEMLARLTKEDPSELGRIEVAYALARAGERRGREILIANLTHERRDVRLDAAGSLVQLGDDAGDRVLEHLLELETHRLGVAAMLARRGNEEGLAALREVLADDQASPELVMRAVVALGRAGDASVRDRLVEILNDGRYHVGAADALAALNDRAAVPALVRQLELPSMRVRAAQWLRRLGEDVALDDLVVALAQGSEAARVSAAEAILILAGPRNLAELD
jgi:HEAT repeat protein